MQSENFRSSHAGINHRQEECRVLIAHNTIDIVGTRVIHGPQVPEAIKLAIFGLREAGYDELKAASVPAVVSIPSSKEV